MYVYVCVFNLYMIHPFCVNHPYWCHTACRQVVRLACLGEEITTYSAFMADGFLIGCGVLNKLWRICDTYIYITIFIIYDFIRIYNYIYIYILPNPIVVVLIFFISFYTSSDILVDHRFHGNFCRTWYCGLGRCSAVDAVNWGKIRRFSLVPGEPFHVWCWNPLAECPRFSLCYPALLVKGRVSQMFASCTSTDRSCCFLFLVHLEIGKIVESSISVVAPTLLGFFQKSKLSTQDGKTWNAGMPHKFLPCIPYQAPFHVWINKFDP